MHSATWRSWASAWATSWGDALDPPANGPGISFWHLACAALELTPNEFGVLEQLLAAQGRVVSAEELLARVRDEAIDPFTGAVKITVSRLRANLGDPSVIETIPRSGYRI